MRHFRQIKTLTFLLVLTLAIAVSSSSVITNDDHKDNLVVKGLVSNPLNLTYGEIASFPLFWEIAELRCVYASSGRSYNWTGIPLFYLLNLAEVQPGAVEVVFRAEDDFSSSLTLDEAMHPTTLLALKVNGTALPYEDGYWDGGLAGGYPFKIVAPCKWGYKWVGWLDEIEVVDYDYKGFYESRGFSDEADIPDCTKVSNAKAAYTAFNATWRSSYEITVFTKADIAETTFNQTVKRICLKISQEEDYTTDIYAIIPKRLLTANFTITSHGMEIQYSLMESEGNSFLYFMLDEGSYTIEISGMLLADITGLHEGKPDCKVDMRDIAVIARAYNTNVGEELYVPYGDINNDEKIDSKDLDIAVEDFGKILPHEPNNC